MGGFLRRALVVVLLGSLFISGCSSNKEDNPDKKRLHSVESFKLSQYDQTDMTLEVDELDDLTFYVEPNAIEKEDIEIINENDVVAKVLLKDIRSVTGDRLIIISVRGMEPGETTIKVKGIENELESDTIKLKVLEKQEHIDDSRKVYMNLNGDKYHLNSSCAGKSAYLATENEALKLYKEPCSKCFN